MKGWSLKKQPTGYVEGRYFPVLERISKLEEAVQKALEKRDEKIAGLQSGLANLGTMIRSGATAQLARRMNIPAEIEKDLNDLDERLLKVEREFDEFREVTNHNLNQLDQVVYRQEVDLSGHAETLRQLAQTPQPKQGSFDFCEGRNYSPLMTKLLEQAWTSENSPRLLDSFSPWLTNEQRSLLPVHYDVVAAVYLNTRGTTEYAHVSNLSAQIKWLKKGEVSQVVSLLVAKGYLAERWIPKEEWRLPRSPPRVFSLTDHCLALVFGHDTTNMAGGSVHRSMQLALFREAISASPPLLCLAISQLPGQSRPDGVLAERVDSKCWKWQDASAVNLETDENVRAHSSTIPGSEGEVYLNLVRPFTAGCKGLILVCLQDSAEKLTQLVNELPSWLGKRIRIQVVYI